MLMISKTSFYKQVEKNLKNKEPYCKNVICQECPFGKEKDCLEAILVDLIVKGGKK